MAIARKLARNFLPLSLRQSVAQSIRLVKDIFSNYDFAIEYTPDSSRLITHTEISQPLMPSEMFANKVQNITLAANRISNSLIAPRKTWSFWHYAQAPTISHGYVAGRNLVNGKLTVQVGGGLCQLSSMMYHLGLLAGLRIEERHAHSVDIYQEHERFTPLGADATVVWGHKDLRMSNPHKTDIVFNCVVHENNLVGRVLAKIPLAQFDVNFIKEQIDTNHAIIHTMVDGQLHTQTMYEQQQGIKLNT